MGHLSARVRRHCAVVPATRRSGASTQSMDARVGIVSLPLMRLRLLSARKLSRAWTRAAWPWSRSARSRRSGYPPDLHSPGAVTVSTSALPGRGQQRGEILDALSVREGERSGRELGRALLRRDFTASSWNLLASSSSDRGLPGPPRLTSTRASSSSPVPVVTRRTAGMRAGTTRHSARPRRSAPGLPGRGVVAGAVERQENTRHQGWESASRITRRSTGLDYSSCATKNRP